MFEVFIALPCIEANGITSTGADMLRWTGGGWSLDSECSLGVALSMSFSQGCCCSWANVIRSFCETVRHLLMQSMTLLDNRSSGLKLRCASLIWASVSNGISPQTMSYKRIPKLQTVNPSPRYRRNLTHSGGEYTRVPEMKKKHDINHLRIPCIKHNNVW